MSEKQTRREFLQTAAVGTAVSLVSAGDCFGMGKPKAEKTANCKERLKLGLASYTTRKLSLDETLQIAKQLKLRYVCLKSMHLPLESSRENIAKALAKVKEAQLELYGGGVIYMNSEFEVNKAFKYAQRAGMTTIVGVPKPELLELVDEKVKQYDIKVAIHNHGPGDKVYPVPQSIYEKINKLDTRIGICIDIGHTMRAGVDPSVSAERFADRLLDVHIKDVSAAEARGHTVEIGRGVIDIPKFVRTLLNVGYSGIASFEYEKDENAPLPGLAESVGYVRGVLATI